MIADVFPAFDEKAFVRYALKGYDALELMPRGRNIAEALGQRYPLGSFENCGVGTTEVRKN